jgi:phosphoribosylglycinamide formyltransferase-1
VVPVLDDDTEATLADRILAAEHRLYSESIALVLNNQYVVDGRRILKKN